MTIFLEAFDPGKSYHELKKFSSGHAVIDKFVTGGSLRQQVKGQHTTAFVLVDSANNDKFVGFYTLTMSIIDRGMLLPKLGTPLPPTVGCARLVMLGVDQGYSKSPDKLGSRLVKHALEGVKTAGARVGCRGMYLDADPGALGFYKKLGFVELQPPSKLGGSTPMFVAIESIF